MSTIWVQYIWYLIIIVIFIIIHIITMSTCSNKFKETRTIRLPNHIGRPTFESSQRRSCTTYFPQKSLVQGHRPESFFFISWFVFGFRFLFLLWFSIQVRGLPEKWPRLWHKEIWHLCERIFAEVQSFYKKCKNFHTGRGPWISKGLTHQYNVKLSFPLATFCTKAFWVKN